MKKVIHRAEERGGADHGWLTTRHSFSFANWHEPTRMGFGALRVLNDDVIAPNTGFGPHPHRDMEIVTIVMSGAVTHEDSMGNRGEVGVGEVQVMSAGTGVVHSERNVSLDESLTLFQLWIEPRSHSIEPRYDQRSFRTDAQAGALTLLVSPNARHKSLEIHQDAYISLGILGRDIPLSYTLNDTENGVYLFIIDGNVRVAGEELHPRDAMGISDVNEFLIEASGDARVLVIEVPFMSDDMMRV